MVKSTIDGSSVPSFLMKCYEMVDDESTDGIISWSESNDSFVIWNMAEFSLQLLSKYFKHSNFASFMRQLNIYGFRKRDTDRWEFSNDAFIRGQKQLMKNILRRRSTQAPNPRKSSEQRDKTDVIAQEIENTGLWKEVESLKIDKTALMQELVKLRQLQETSESKLLILSERLQEMETDQQQMLSFLIMAMHNPGFLNQLLQPKEKNWRKSEAGKNNMLEEVPEGMLIRYHQQPSVVDDAPHLNSEKPMEFDLLDGMKDFIINVDFMKIYMDEKYSSPENLSCFSGPDSTDDSVLQQLLLSSHFAENTLDDNLDIEEPNNAESMEIESTVGAIETGKALQYEPEIQKFDIESTTAQDRLKSRQNLDILTKKMALLASQRKPTAT